jgi:hypothetical protein
MYARVQDMVRVLSRTPLAQTLFSQRIHIIQDDAHPG